MQSIRALSLAPAGKNWLASSRQPRILHVFERVCNLVNERREILSIVIPQIGNGPFNLVIKEDFLFPDYLNAQSKISIQTNHLQIENLIINMGNAKLWPPIPNWQVLYTRRNNIQHQMAKLPITNYQPSLPTSLLTAFSTALVNADIPIAIEITRQLAGLGQGLTPAGDDFILGAVLAAWIIHPRDVAGILAEEITNAAAPLTTSLSAAWLKSAGRGEAGILWHNFFNALIAEDPQAIQVQSAKLLSIGHTSGADAFAGFMSTLIHAEENHVLFKYLH